MKMQVYKNAPFKKISTHCTNQIHRMSKLEFKLVNKSNYHQLNCQLWVEKFSDGDTPAFHGILMRHSRKVF